MSQGASFRRWAREAGLVDGENLPEIAKDLVRADVERRRLRAEFLARGLCSRDEGRRVGESVDVDASRERLLRQIDAACVAAPKTRR